MRASIKSVKVITSLSVLLLLLSSVWLSAANSTVQVQLLSPQPNSNVEIDDIIIVFSMLQDMEKVKLEGIKMELDNIDVSPSIQLNQGILSYLPLDIKLGAHTVTLQISDAEGKRIEPITFNFNIIPSTVKYKTTRTTPIIRFSGQNSMTYETNSVTGPGASARQEPTSSNSLNITATGSYKGVNYEAGVVISSESEFNQQPTDTYYIKIYTDWGGIVAGDNFPSYSKLVMTGNRVRGVEAYSELDSSLGKIKVQGVYGQALKRIDSTYTPERTLQAVDASINYDDALTISMIYMASQDETEDNMLTGADYEENEVYGAAIEYTPSYNFNLRVYYAQSDTTDLRTSETSDVSTPSEAFIGNNGALDASLSANISTWYSLSAAYTVTGLNYQSFGNPWKQVDVTSINATNSFRLFDNALMLSATVALQQDNLSENLATTTKSESYSGYGTLTLGTNLPSISANYMLNISKSENLDLSGLSSNTETTSWSATMTEMIRFDEHSFTVRANYGENNSDNLITPEYSMDSKYYGTSASWTLPNYGSLGATYRVSESTSYSTNSTTTTDTISFQVSYPIIENVLNISGSYQFDKQDDTLDTMQNEKDALGFTVTWTINDFQQLYGSYNYIQYNNLINPDYSNYESNSFSLTYTITFDGLSY